MLLVVIPLNGYQLVRHAGERSTDHTPDLSAGACWIAEHASESAVVMTSEPIGRFLYTQRLTIDVTCDIAEAKRLLLGAKPAADYVLIAPQLEWSDSLSDDPCSVNVIEPPLLSYPERFRLVYEEPSARVRVYEVNETLPSGTRGKASGVQGLRWSEENCQIGEGTR